MSVDKKSAMKRIIELTHSENWQNDKEGNKKILVERRESTTSFGIMRMRTTGMSC